MIILDHIESLKLDDTEELKHFNELRSLQYLSQGLWFLYNQVQRIEANIVGKLDKKKKVFIFGNAPELREVPQDLVACAFHWYAVSLCNYVKMVGWLTNNNDTNKARGYMEHVLPQVYLWRHKIAAHFGIIDPHKNDNAADLAKSVMFPISFDDDAFFANSLTLTLGSKDKKSTSRQDMRWSLTHIHRELILRYWPSA